MEYGKILEQLGFNKSDIRIYLYLVEKGIKTTGPLMTDLGVSSSKVYTSLSKLQKEGYISEIIIDNKKHFQANKPEILLEKIEEMKNNTENFVKNLNIKKYPEQKEYTCIYTGISGFKQVFNEFANIYDGTDEILVIEFSEEIETSQTVKNTILNIAKKRVETKTNLRILINEKLKENYGKIREKEKYSEVRYLKKNEAIFSSGLSIYKDYVIQHIWDKKEPKIYLIKNKQIADSHKNYFNLIWNNAKK